MNRFMVALCFAALGLGLAAAGSSQAQDAAGGGPRYASDGTVVFPTHYREWVYLSTGFGMSYSSPPPGGGPANPNFTNVFVAPDAYRTFAATGKWPEGTMLVLEVRRSTDHGSIVRNGHFQQDLLALDVEVKDSAHFPEKWRFFTFGADADGNATTGSAVSKNAGCLACHSRNAAVENTFAQFYPTVLHIATLKGTVNESYRRAQAAEATPTPH